MTISIIGADTAPKLDWIDASDAIADGHRQPAAEIDDHVTTVEGGTVLTRSACIEGIGLLVKTANIFPGNREIDRPTVNGVATVFDDRTGELRSIVDFALLTEWKTAADSLLAARHLAPTSVDSVLIVGAGQVAASLLRSYRELYPDAQFAVHSRTIDSSEAFAASRPGVVVARDLAAAVRSADLVTVATTSSVPVIHGEWLRSGQHIDLIGAFRADMREADDEVMRRGRVFVDSRRTTISHIGELLAPIDAGVIGAEDVIADFYDLASGRFARTSDDDITVFKNGGGAHLDLMVANYIIAQASKAP